MGARVFQLGTIKRACGSDPFDPPDSARCLLDDPRPEQMSSLLIN